MNNKVFFAENGLTSTSANFISNMAKEYVADLQEELHNTSFFKEEISLVGQSNTTVVSEGVSSLDYIDKDLASICKAFSLIAWLREAIKAKQRLASEVQKYDFKQWCKDNGKDYPDEPEFIAAIDKDDVIDTWSIKDRNHYFELQTKVSQYGKFIHPDGVFSIARKKLNKHPLKNISYTESGRDTIIHSATSTISVDEVNSKFMALQSEWRKAQAELNGYEHKIQMAVDEDTNKKNSSYELAYAEYQRKAEALQAEFKTWKDITSQQVAALKIVIPDHLKSIYDVISKLAK